MAATAYEVSKTFQQFNYTQYQQVVVHDHMSAGYKQERKEQSCLNIDIAPNLGPVCIHMIADI